MELTGIHISICNCCPLANHYKDFAAFRFRNPPQSGGPDGRTRSWFLWQSNTKVDGAVSNEPLTEEMLPATGNIADEKVTSFSSGPAHRARQTVEMLRHETPEFTAPVLWPLNSPDLNPVDYHIWEVMQERVYYIIIWDVAELSTVYRQEAQLRLTNPRDAFRGQSRSPNISG